jgi:hypothetical protein
MFLCRHAAASAIGPSSAQRIAWKRPDRQIEARAKFPSTAKSCTNINK